MIFLGGRRGQQEVNLEKTVPINLKNGKSCHGKLKTFSTLIHVVLSINPPAPILFASVILTCIPPLGSVPLGHLGECPRETKTRLLSLYIRDTDPPTHRGPLAARYRTLFPSLSALGLVGFHPFRLLSALVTLPLLPRLYFLPSIIPVLSNFLATFTPRSFKGVMCPLFHSLELLAVFP